MENAEEIISFKPPVYRQRYQRILDIIHEVRPRKLVDFGCAECNFLRLLKNENVEEVIGVDIDRGTLERHSGKIRPLFTDFLRPRVKPLTMRLYEGSVSDYDKRLEGCDLVTLIEVIEHLTPAVLKSMPGNLFFRLRPSVVIMTTPNADFNVLFNLNGKFRHWDHKFEWTRREFELWCKDVCLKYDYRVSFHGIGQGPVGSEHLGCCSQMAIFVSDACKSSLEFYKSSTLKSENAGEYSPYHLVEECVHPQEQKVDRTCKIASIVEACIEQVANDYRKRQDVDLTSNQLNEKNHKSLSADNLLATGVSSHVPIETNFSEFSHCTCGNKIISGQYDDACTDNSYLLDCGMRHPIYSNPEDFWRPTRSQIFIRYLYETYFKGKEDSHADGQFDDAYEAEYEDWHCADEDAEYCNLQSYLIDGNENFTSSKKAIVIPMSALLSLRKLKCLNATAAEIMFALKHRCDIKSSDDYKSIFIHFNDSEESDDNEDCCEYSSEEPEGSSAGGEQVVYTMEDFLEENWDI